jgi:hypothetical protein
MLELYAPAQSTGEASANLQRCAAKSPALRQVLDEPGDKNLQLSVDDLRSIGESQF